MFDKKTAQQFVHELSNKIMILEGNITVMTLDTKHVQPENIKKMADTATAASEISAVMRAECRQVRSR
jgi:predicted lactoylglutathione lyase